MAKNLLEEMNKAGIPDIQSEKKSLISEMEAGGYVSPKEGVKTALGIKKPTFFSRVSSDIQKRGMEWADVFQQVGEGKITALEAGVSAVGKALQLFTQDIPMDVVRSVLPKWLKEGIKTSFATSPLVKPFITPITSEGKSISQIAFEKYDQWKEKNPRAATDLESFINIATAIPVIKSYEMMGEKIVEQVKQLPQKTKGTIEKIQALPAEKELQKAQESITLKPNELSKGEYDDLLRQGKISPKTATQPAKYILSDKEKIMAEKNASLLQSGDPVKNGQSILDEIIAQDAKVGEYLRSKNIIFNKNQLKSYLMEKLKSITDITIPSEARLLKAKEDLVNAFVDGIKTNNMEGAWQSRKAFDQVIQNKINAFAGTPTLKKDLVIGLRNGVQDFIAEQTGDTVYKTFMTNMRELYTVLDIVNVKAVTEKGKNAIQIWIKMHPAKAKIIGAIGGLGAGAVGYQTLKNLGVPLP